MSGGLTDVLSFIESGVFLLLGKKPRKVGVIVQMQVPNADRYAEIPRLAP